MTDFWKSPTGEKLTGSAEDANVGTFKVVPDNTKALGMIKNFELKIFKESVPFYQVTYELIDGDYKGCQVRQKINVFEGEPKKAHRALNMMLRIFQLCSYKPSHTEQPSNDDLAPMKSKILGIKIQEWSDDGKNGNWVSEVHAADKDFVPETGVKLEVNMTPQSAGSRASAKRAEQAENDIPW